VAVVRLGVGRACCALVRGEHKAGWALGEPGTKANTQERYLEASGAWDCERFY